ncbi:MAG: SRPBCC domain-containing protein [Caulobacteraceae bacterium]
MPLKIEHRLGIPASAEAIWAVIVDVTAWSQWNPLYPKADGLIRMGAPLTLEVAIPGRPPRTIRPVVADWVPNEQVHWTLSTMGGLVKSTRYIEIEQLTATGCIFSNGEIFEGPLGALVAGRIRRDLRAAFAAMGEAVKVRVEALGDIAQPMLL